jgi:hypothetical protein
LSPTDRATNTAFIAAVVTATAMIAFQMAAKATRDALFLSTFDVSALPRMVIVAALVAVGVALLASRWMTAVGPGRLVPAAFALSAALLLAEWALIGPFRRGVAIALYLHYAALGAVLISGFWSVVNERFDPRTAKRYVGRIAAGATVGGVLGGLLAERVGATLSMAAMLPILAGIHFLCAFVVNGVPAERRPAPQRRSRRSVGRPPERSGLKTLANTPYLRGLVALVLLATITEVLIDYVFKARATGALGSGESLLRFFAAFYTGVSLLTVLVQAAASRVTLQHLGLTRTVALLPAVTGLGSVGALAFPGLASASAARGSEQVLRNGLYRSGYELLFTPLQPEQKRATKTLVDVGVVRLGDILGGAIVQVLLLVAVAGVSRLLLGLAAVISVVAVVVALGLRRGYMNTLERSLLSRAVELDLEEVDDITTRTAVLHSTGTLALGLTAAHPTPTLDHAIPTPAMGVKSPVAAAEVPGREKVATPATPLDPEVALIVELRSRDAPRVIAALGAGRLTPTVVPHVIPLLAWDEVVADALAALREVAHQVTGQLADRLLDHGEEFAVRRRLPLALVASPTERALDTLFRGLDDPRFEVRYRCGRALVRLLELNPKLRVEEERAYAAVLGEVAVDKGVWESHRLLDKMEDEEWSPVMDEVLRERANRSLEHVFTVLSLVLPRQPLKIAFRGLHAKDAILRGTALEYLESALPEHVRVQLWPFLEDTRPRRRESRTTDEVLQDLFQSNQSIVMNLKELRKQKKEESG